MIPPDRLVLLDTNILLHLLRGKAAGHWIDEQYGLRVRPERPLISTISIGEMLRLGSRNAWGANRRRWLHTLLSELVVVDIGHADILERYAEIGAHVDGAGQSMQQNDLWIAATAAAKRAVLVTTDTDFDALHPHFLERIRIDPGQLPRGE